MRQIVVKAKAETVNERVFIRWGASQKNQIFLFYASFVCRFYAFYANAK